MLKFYAHNFVILTGMLAKIEAVCEKASPNGVLQRDRPAPNVETRLAQLKTLCEVVGLKMSALCVDSFGFSDPNRKITFIDLAVKVRELRNRIEDELSLCLLLQVAPEKRGTYENADSFGPQVTLKFGSAAYDVEEASKCLALDRSTACVMHLMRVVEAAVDAIALGVGVPAAAVKGVTTWEHLLKEINDKIRANNTTKVPSWLASRGFYENALAYLHAVKDAWRNPSMHLDKKYTEEEAESIYAAVRNLMRHLAQHLDELGTFTP